MNVTSEMRQPMMRGVVSLVISVPLWYCQMFTGRFFRGGDAPSAQFPYVAGEEQYEY